MSHSESERRDGRCFAIVISSGDARLLLSCHMGERTLASDFFFFLCLFWSTKCVLNQLRFPHRAAKRRPRDGLFLKCYTAILSNTHPSFSDISFQRQLIRLESFTTWGEKLARLKSSGEVRTRAFTTVLYGYHISKVGVLREPNFFSPHREV